jgi:hypothetical protein
MLSFTSGKIGWEELEPKAIFDDRVQELQPIPIKEKQSSE